MTTHFLKTTLAVTTALLATTAVARAESLSDAYRSSLLERCITNGGLDPALPQNLSDDDLLKALTDCANRRSAAKADTKVVYTRAPASTYESSAPYSESRTYVRSPRYEVSEAPPVEVGGRSSPIIGDIVIGNRFGGGRGDGGGQVPPPVFTPPPNDPTIPPIAAPNLPPAGAEARLAGIDGTIASGIASGAITPREAAILGAAQLQARSIIANLGNAGGAELAKQRVLDQLAARTNAALRNPEGIPDNTAFARRLSGKGQRIGMLPGAATGAAVKNPLTGAANTAASAGRPLGKQLGSAAASSGNPAGTAGSAATRAQTAQTPASAAQQRMQEIRARLARHSPSATTGTPGKKGVEQARLPGSASVLPGRPRVDARSTVARPVATSRAVPTRSQAAERRMVQQRGSRASAPQRVVKQPATTSHSRFQGRSAMRAPRQHSVRR